MNKIDEAIWIAKTLFYRNKVSGSTANLSFIENDKLFITATGSCFGNLNRDSFSIIENDKVTNDIRPSKELTLHKYMYEFDNEKTAVIHTHSTFTTFWSCVYETEDEFKIETPTPYLDMKVGKIGFVKYEKPGSKELFDAFLKQAQKGYNAYILKNHGVIVGAKTLMEAFYMLEEIEEASFNARLLKIMNR